MPKYGLIVCFSQVIKGDIGEHKFDSTVRQKLGVGNWKKIGVLAFQKVAKTCNIGKKNPVAGDIDYVRYLSIQNVKCHNGYLLWGQQFFINWFTGNYFEILSWGGGGVRKKKSLKLISR